MYFKDEHKAIEWRMKHSYPDEWVIVHRGIRRMSGHRYELTYSKFDEQGKLYSKYIICYSKKEALILERKIKEANENYITNIKKLY